MHLPGIRRNFSLVNAAISVSKTIRLTWLSRGVAANTVVSPLIKVREAAERVGAADGDLNDGTGWRRRADLSLAIMS